MTQLAKSYLHEEPNTLNIFVAVWNSVQLCKWAEFHGSSGRRILTQREPCMADSLLHDFLLKTYF